MTPDEIEQAIAGITDAEIEARLYRLLEQRVRELIRKNSLSTAQIATMVCDLYRSGWRYDKIAEVLCLSIEQVRNILTSSPQSFGEDHAR